MGRAVIANLQGDHFVAINLNVQDGPQIFGNETYKQYGVFYEHVAGSLDDITPLSAQYGLVKKFPSAKLKVITNVGHLTHYETPEQVAKLVQAFITSV